MLGTLILLWSRLFAALWSQQLIILNRYLARRRRRICRLPEKISLPLLPSKTRSLWMRVRGKHWWETVVLAEFTDREWQADFRMTHRSFMKLSALMEKHMAPEPKTVRAPIHPSLSPALHGYSCYAWQAFFAGSADMHFSEISVKDIPKEIMSNFWSNSLEISERTRQKGLQYAFEKYIYNIICRRSNIKIEAKAHRSYCKSQPPHILTIHVQNKCIKEQQCSCIAG